MAEKNDHSGSKNHDVDDEIIKLLPEDPFDMNVSLKEEVLVQENCKVNVGQNLVMIEPKAETKTETETERCVKMVEDEGYCVLGCKAAGLSMCFGCDKYAMKTKADDEGGHSCVLGCKAAGLNMCFGCDKYGKFP